MMKHAIRRFPDWFVEGIDDGYSDNIKFIPRIFSKKHLEELDDVEGVVLSHKQNTQLVVFRGVWISVGLLRTHSGDTVYEGVLVQSTFNN